VTAEGITETEMGQTLLNGNNVAMVSLVLILSIRKKESIRLMQ
jgi:hypothetical protein